MTVQLRKFTGGARNCCLLAFHRLSYHFSSLRQKLFFKFPGKVNTDVQPVILGETVCQAQSINWAGTLTLAPHPLSVTLIGLPDSDKFISGSQWWHTLMLGITDVSDHSRRWCWFWAKGRNRSVLFLWVAQVIQALDALIHLIPISVAYIILLLWNVLNLVLKLFISC